MSNLKMTPQASPDVCPRCGAGPEFPTQPGQKLRHFVCASKWWLAEDEETSGFSQSDRCQIACLAKELADLKNSGGPCGHARRFFAGDECQVCAVALVSFQLADANDRGSTPAESKPMNHEFDSSRTCNYCGIAAEQVKGIAENERCPAREKIATPAEPVDCPECKGTGKSGWVPVCVKPLTESQAKELADAVSKCSFCDGAGKVEPKQLEWRTIGEQWQQARREVCVGMRQWAEHVGCLPSDYCDMEAGRLQPDSRYALRATPVEPSEVECTITPGTIERRRMAGIAKRATNTPLPVAPTSPPEAAGKDATLIDGDWLTRVGFHNEDGVYKLVCIHLRVMQGHWRINIGDYWNHFADESRDDLRRLAAALKIELKEHATAEQAEGEFLANESYATITTNDLASLRAENERLKAALASKRCQKCHVDGYWFFATKLAEEHVAKLQAALDAK